MIDKLQVYKDQTVQAEQRLVREGFDDASLPQRQWLQDHLEAYVSRGKHVRSGLFLTATQSWFNEELDDAAYQVGAAVELLHDAVLIQDDVMDNDRRRRGEPALHAAFETIHDDRRRAEGMAVGCSDFLIFTAMQALSNHGLAGLAAAHFRPVCTAQVRDITYDDVAGEGREPTQEDIISLYKQKTGQYTFALPLRLGLRYTGNDDRGYAQELGDVLGVIFQLRDDELNVYGDTATTGKPSMTDIEEDKRTVLRHFLLDEHPEAEGLLGRRLDQAEKDRLTEYLDDVRPRYKEEQKRFADQARALINQCPYPEPAKDDLNELTQYIINRDL